MVVYGNFNRNRKFLIYIRTKSHIFLIFSENLKITIDKREKLWYNNYVVKQQRLIRRSRVVGRARATGNRVTTKNSSRVRISPSPPKQRTEFRSFCFCEEARSDSSVERSTHSVRTKVTEGSPFFFARYR